MANPTIENDLVLLSTFISNSFQSHVCEVTYAVDDAGLNLSAQEWADAAQTSFANRWKGTLSDQCLIVKTTSVKGDGTSTFTTGESTADPTSGEDNGGKLPSNCAVLGRKITALGGRTNRGRVYLPWVINENAVVNVGLMDSGTQSDFQDIADNWLDDLAGGDSNGMVIANRHYNLPWTNPARRLTSITTGPQVISCRIDQRIATQRRRLR